MRFFDLRLPLGWLFGALGLLLVIAGLHASPAADARALGVNINLIWGAVMVAFALFCLWLARREARRRMAAPRAPNRLHKEG
jgi:protein-S-isoprenylcysteine O-methyltransferase Ste14